MIAAPMVRLKNGSGQSWNSPARRNRVTPSVIRLGTRIRRSIQLCPASGAGGVVCIFASDGSGLPRRDGSRAAVGHRDNDRTNQVAHDDRVNNPEQKLGNDSDEKEF